jgi:hypothetical protein
MASSSLSSSPTVARRERISPAPTAIPSTPGGVLERLTMEHLVYGLLVVIALVARSLGLGSRPLAPAEAEAALAAWQLSQGLGPVADAGTPLLIGLQTLLFFLAGGSDFLARLAPNLAAAALPLALWRWRPWVGRRPALLAALLLTFSPLVNAFARRADGTAFVLLGLTLALAGWGQVERRQRIGWRWLLTGVGLMLIAGPAAPAALLGLVLVMALSRRQESAERPSPTWSDAVPGLVLVFGGGTVFLTRLATLGLMALNWSAWLQAFVWQPQAWLWGLVRWLGDEPLLVLLGTAATLWLWRWPQPTPARRLGQAGLVLLLVAVLQGPSAAGTRAVAAVLLAVPAAQALGRFWRRRRHLTAAAWPAEGPVFVAVLSILLIVAALALFGYTFTLLRVQLLLFGLTLLVAVLFMGLFTYLVGRQPALLLGGAVGLVFLGAYNLAAIWGLAFDATPPRYAALYAVETRPAVRDLVVTVGDLGQRRHGERWSLPVTLVSGSASDATLQWYLRRAPSLRVVPAVGGAEAGPLVVAPATVEPALSEAYAGQRFGVFTSWQPQHGTSQQQLAWMLYRVAPWDLPTADVVLWADVNLLTLSEPTP